MIVIYEKKSIKKPLEKMCLGVDRSLNSHKMFLALKFKEHL
jgi:hypothetical protein